MSIVLPKFLSKEFKEKYNLKNFIIQAPMAGGISTPSLVSAVVKNNSIGFLAAGYISAEALEKQIIEVKETVNGIFGVNLFVIESKKRAKYTKPEILTRIEKELNIYKTKIMTAEINEENDAKIDFIIKHGVKIVSFTFGLPKQKWIDKLKENNIYIIGSCTNLLEAKAIEESGCDAVVVQGFEAGGHRGSFLNKNDEIGLFSLLQEVAQSIKIPIIAAGGIANGRGILAAKILGATAVQIGTGFLLTKESSALEAYKNALLHSHAHEIIMTERISGKKARGKGNKFVTKLQNSSNKVFPYPIQNAMTKEIRSCAQKENKSDYMSLWSGQSVNLIKDILSVEDYLKNIMTEYSIGVKKFSLLHNDF
ncbi:NAD(P)H-dependent flavin oxidoreductase [Fluviispira multicolorata]|uniref:Propionate 3-nitronate monooxygenase n=1 Tax=Fluviispira multicolorata TaxID=2654512 RepID=A0A833N5F5_9BACT|nr:nitronate monooxygenase [Fluviispira multicolorata]KAB8030697.1 nitronate monooxygenase [Fluviispira multicolorata]